MKHKSRDIASTIFIDDKDYNSFSELFDILHDNRRELVLSGVSVDIGRCILGKDNMDNMSKREINTKGVNGEKELLNSQFFQKYDKIYGFDIILM